MLKRVMQTVALAVALVIFCAGPGPKNGKGGDGDKNRQQNEQQPQRHPKKQHPDQQDRKQQNDDGGKKRGDGSGKGGDGPGKGGDGAGKAGNPRTGSTSDDPPKDIKGGPDGERGPTAVKDEGDGDGKKVAKNADADQGQGKQAKRDGDGPDKHHPGSVDHREQRQAHRLQQGVKHGQLTPDEISKLEAQEKALNDAEAKFKSDGKLSRDEAKQLQQQLNDASQQIWAQRHDTEGNQRSVVLLGKDVIARDDLTKKIESGELTGPEARQFAGDFRKMINMKKRLSKDNLSDSDRAKLQGEYDDLLDKYFQMNEEKQSKEK
jgi:hypothetical protein